LGSAVEHRLVRQPQEPADAGVEFCRLVVGEGVVEAQHRHAVLDWRELLGPRRAHPQRRGIVAHQVGEAFLDVEVAALEGVVVAVGDRRGVLLVIAQVVAGQFVGQALQLLDGLGFGEVGDGDLGHGRIRRLENGGRLAGVAGHAKPHGFSLSRGNPLREWKGSRSAGRRPEG
jgi:hypothetical protein